MGFLYTPDGAGFYVHHSRRTNEILAIFALKKDPHPPERLPPLQSIGITPQFVAQWCRELVATQGPAYDAALQKKAELARIGGGHLLAIGKARASGASGAGRKGDDPKAQRAAAKKAAGRAAKAGSGGARGSGTGTGGGRAAAAAAAAAGAAAPPQAGGKAPETGGEEHST